MPEEKTPLLSEWDKAALLAAQDWNALKLRRPLNVAVVGSRVTTPEMVQAVHRLIDGMPDSFAIVSGGAKGVDSVAQARAEGRKMFVKVFKPNWRRFGKSAGFRRNRKIVGSSDVVFAFWDGESQGTQHSMRLAHEMGKPLIVQKFAPKDYAPAPTKKVKGYQPKIHPAQYMHRVGPHKKRAGD